MKISKENAIVLRKWLKPVQKMTEYRLWQARLPSSSSINNPIHIYDYSHRIVDLIEALARRDIGLNQEELEHISRSVYKAYRLSHEGHDGVLRKSKEPYFEHPMAVAEMLVEWGLGVEEVLAALCHDLREDAYIGGKRVSLDFIVKELGKRPALLVEGVTELGKEPEFKGEKPSQEQILKKMVQYINKDLGIIFLKLADRLHNMRTLQYMSESVRIQKSNETLNVYAFFADRLGMWDVKRELEDLSFKYLEPAEHEKLDNAIQRISEESEDKINEVVNKLHDIFSSRGMQLQIIKEKRCIYELYERMNKRKIKPLDLSPQDIWRLNIVVPETTSCYRVLEAVHSWYESVPGEAEFNIYKPLPNGHRFLHDYVEVPALGKLLIQVRHSEMYANYRKGILSEIKGDKEWYKQIPIWLKMALGFNDVRDGLTPTIIVYTPMGEHRELYNGSTPLDFAREIRQELFIHAHDALVNGRRVGLFVKLKHGDRVEIESHLKARPDALWREFVQMPRAIASLQTYLTNRKSRKIIKSGIDMLNQYLAPLFLEINEMEDSALYLEFIKVCGYGSPHKVLEMVGKGEKKASEVVEEMISFYEEGYNGLKESEMLTYPYYFSVRTENKRGRLDKITSGLKNLGLNISDIFQVASDDTDKAIVVVAVDVLKGSGNIAMLSQIQKQRIKNLGQSVGEYMALPPGKVKEYKEKAGV